MTLLRQEMIKAMELRNLSKNTQRYYRAAVIGVARYHQQSPDTLTQEMIEDYLLHLKSDKGNTLCTCATVVAGLRFFFQGEKPHLSDNLLLTALHVITKFTSV